MKAHEHNIEEKVPADPNRPGPTTQAWIRYTVQAGFLVFCVLLGLEFQRFVLSLDSPLDIPVAPRPPSVEAFLPISSLMSLVYLVKTGEASRVHPAGLVIFSLAVLSALLLRRGFCSWVCPVGTLSEYAHKAGRRIVGRNLSLPPWLDRPLRLCKYGLLGFFLYYILPLPPERLRVFIQGPYNRIADVKMYLLFAHPSMTFLSVLLLLTALSFAVKNFWCRYLCPYGALLGILSWASPLRVRRCEPTCIGCRRCDRACPNSIRVSEKNTVASEECTACFTCIQICPTGSLCLGPARGRLHVPERVYVVFILAAFVFTPRTFSAAGYWYSETPPTAYRQLYRILDRIDHPRTGGPGLEKATPRVDKRRSGSLAGIKASS